MKSLNLCAMLLGLLKRYLLTIFSLFLPFFIRAQPDDSKIIFDLEKQRIDAIAQGDETALNNFLDDSYYAVTASGKVVNKPEQLALYKSTNPYITFTTEDVSVNVFESTATVIGTLVGKTKSGATIGKTRYLYVYLKKEGKWKIIISQETVVIKE